MQPPSLLTWYNTSQWKFMLFLRVRASENENCVYCNEVTITLIFSLYYCEVSLRMETVEILECNSFCQQTLGLNFCRVLFWQPYTFHSTATSLKEYTFSLYLNTQSSQRFLSLISSYIEYRRNKIRTYFALNFLFRRSYFIKSRLRIDSKGDSTFPMTLNWKLRKMKMKSKTYHRYNTKILLEWRRVQFNFKLQQ